MAEIDKNNPMSEAPVEEQDINVEIETPTDISEEEDIPAEEKPEDFYKNLAEDLDERVLGRISNRLIQDYRQDKVSR